MDASDESEIMSREALFEKRKDKIKTQIAAAIKILKQDVEPLEVADRFIHESFQLMKEGVSQRHSNFSEEQVNQRVWNLLSLSKKIKISRKRRKNSWQK